MGNLRLSIVQQLTNEQVNSQAKDNLSPDDKRYADIWWRCMLYNGEPTPEEKVLIERKNKKKKLGSFWKYDNVYPETFEERFGMDDPFEQKAK